MMDVQNIAERVLAPNAKSALSKTFRSGWQHANYHFGKKRSAIMVGPNIAAQNTTVFGVFKTPPPADRAVSRLTSAGFSNSDVSLLKSNIDGLLSVMGIAQNEASSYQEYVKMGGVLLSVHCSNSLEIDRANTILKQNGAEHISSTDEQAVGTHGVHRQ
jgi:hypothetical protein